jgi:hypothetical protein
MGLNLMITQNVWERYSTPTTADLGKTPLQAKCIAGKSYFAGNRYRRCRCAFVSRRSSLPLPNGLRFSRLTESQVGYNGGLGVASIFILD